MIVTKGLRGGCMSGGCLGRAARVRVLGDAYDDITNAAAQQAYNETGGAAGKSSSWQPSADVSPGGTSTPAGIQVSGGSSGLFDSLGKLFSSGSSSTPSLAFLPGSPSIDTVAVVGGLAVAAIAALMLFKK